MRDIYRCVVCGKYVESDYHCGYKAKLLMSGKDRLRLSKLISYILRHDPWCVGLSINREGWVTISELVKAIRERWIHKELYQWVTKEHIIALAKLDPRGRFEVRDEMIRARYGHNKALNISIEYREDNEVKTLYHGTIKSNVRSILSDGIKPMKRKYVHLAIDVSTACEIGSRHGRNAVFIVVDAECLRKEGHKVMIASKVIRLTDYVPPKCIKEVKECTP